MFLARPAFISVFSVFSDYNKSRKKNQENSEFSSFYLGSAQARYVRVGYDYFTRAKEPKNLRRLAKKRVSALSLERKQRINNMDAKKIIAPLQRWLLAQGRCVGCGRPLEGGKKQRHNGTIHITCECRRIFVHEPALGIFRRAEFQEALAH